MLLFQKRFHAGLVDGSVTLTFRRWARSRVRPGGRYRVHPIGVVQVTDVREVRLGDVPARDAREAGFGSLAELRAYLEAPPTKPPTPARSGEPARDPVTDDTLLFRVALRHAGEEDRVDLALEDELTPEDVEAVAARLRRLDEKGPSGPWTRATLAAIGRRPHVAASRLASALGRETAPFKEDVRKLKRLGLTASYEVGYDLTPRGRAFLRARRRW
jgi:hypothetical protein